MMFCFYHLGTYGMNMGYGIWVHDDFGCLVRPNDLPYGYFDCEDPS